MNIRKSISKDAIELELKSDDKDGVISELVDMMLTTSKLKDRKAVLKLIHDREKKMSTGMNCGIAIPHAKTDMIDSVTAVIGIKKAGLDFDSLDGEPAQIFIMTLSPAKRAGPHVQFLAEISRLLDIESNREKIMAAETKEEVLDILSNGNGH